MQNSATVIYLSPRWLRQYRSRARLDKDGRPGEGTDRMTMADQNADKAAAPPSRVGVLLVNLGTPNPPDAKGWRPYLREFLSDPRVIENQGPVWQLILNGFILRTRPRIKARDYLKIWNKERNESPLKTITRAQSEKLARGIADHDHVEIGWAMRYGNPSIRAGIESLMKRGWDRLLAVPLYPQN